LSELSTHHQPESAREPIPTGLTHKLGQWCRPFPLRTLSVAILLVCIAFLLAANGKQVEAVTPTAHEEWIAPALNTADNNKHMDRLARIKAGDHAVSVLQRLEFSLATARKIVAASKGSHNLKDIRAGQTFRRIDSDTDISIIYNIDTQQRLHIRRQLNQLEWQCKVENRPLITRQHIASGIIHGSLFGAAEKAGMDQRTTMNLVDIFAWDIDFARDMRDGDSFRVIYEEHFDDNGNMLDSSILAAEFINQGNHFNAVRYTRQNGKSGYYTPDGKSMRKAYLKAAVKFSRISSRFSLRRKHPVLGYTRAHRGVDYAASSGTPIHAIGDGVIKFSGWKSGYGRFVLITHNNRNHSTAYGHMRAFARGIKRGVRVHQGQVIGYVGMSGLATGPHLHFEFRVRGVAVNPLTVKHPPARPVPSSERARFQQLTAPLITQLKQLQSQAEWG